jgi:hypothetical protein
MSGLAQQSTRERSIILDTVDGKLDLSRFLINMRGFIPVPFIITEPALGGIGVGLATVFMKQRPPAVDTIRGVRKVTLTRPDMTGLASMGLRDFTLD